MLINQSAVRQFVLDATRTMRPGWDCTQVSREALMQIDGRLRRAVRQMVQTHPSGCGKTFRP